MSSSNIVVRSILDPLTCYHRKSEEGVTHYFSAPQKKAVAAITAVAFVALMFFTTSLGKCTAGCVGFFYFASAVIKIWGCGGDLSGAKGGGKIHQGGSSDLARMLSSIARMLFAVVVYEFVKEKIRTFGQWLGEPRRRTVHWNSRVITKAQPHAQQRFTSRQRQNLPNNLDVNEQRRAQQRFTSRQRQNPPNNLDVNEQKKRAQQQSFASARGVNRRGQSGPVSGRGRGSSRRRIGPAFGVWHGRHKD